MTEVFTIFIQFLIFLIIFSFPFTPKILNETLKIRQLNFSYIDAHSINLIFFCLFLSIIFIFKC